MALPAGLSTVTITGGPYADPTGAVKFAGMVGRLSLTSPLRYNGAEVDGTVTVTVASDGTFTAGPLVNTSDPAVAAQGVAYRMDWNVGRFDDCPGGQRSLTFAVAAGTTTADYDTLTPVTASALAGSVGLPFVTSVNGHTGSVTTGDLGIGAAFVVHGATASVARPSTSLPVVWFGSVSPTNADATLDVYIPVSSDGGAAALASLQAALAAKADLAGGVVPDAELPARLSDAGLRVVIGTEFSTTGAATFAPVAGLQPAGKLPPLFTGHGFTLSKGGTASDNLNDTSDAALGSQSLKVVTDGIGTDTRYERLSAFSLDLTGRYPVLWVKVDDVTHLAAIEVWFGKTGFGTAYRFSPWNSVTTEARIETIQSGKWIRATMPWSTQTLIGTFGTPARNNLDSIRVAVRDDATGNPVTVHIGGVGSMPEPRDVWPNGVVSLTFDDGYASQNTAARAKMDQYGFPGVAYVICDIVGAAGRLSLTNLSDMQRQSGWQIGAHAYSLGNHNAVGGFTGLAPDALTQELRLLKQWMLDNGFPDGEDFAYPQGYFNEQVLGQIRRFYRTARSTISRTQETWPPAEPHKMRVRNCTASTTLANIQGWVDDAYTNGYWLILVLHSIDDSSLAGGNSLPTAIFNSAVDYIAGKAIPVLTVADVAAGRKLARGTAPSLAPGGANDLYLDGGHATTAGAATYSRLHASTGIPVTSGQMRLTQFTPSSDRTISNLTVATGGTAGATLTLARLGLYTVNADGSKTLVAATLSDTTLATVGSTVYTRALDAGGGLPTSYTLKRGQRYALGVLFVGTTMPNFAGIGPAVTGLAALAPVMAEQLSGQADLPATVAAGAASTSNNLIWGYLS
jgi:peptidoglycan/xylan/chitin deacetylase (PgdA/CDA1 family)